MRFDPDYFYSEDPLNCSSDELDSGETYLYDTYDQIIDTIESDIDIDGAELGIALALADEIADSERRYNLNKNTDDENWKNAAKYMSLERRFEKKKNLRPFEQFVDDICSGRRPLFDED